MQEQTSEALHAWFRRVEPICPELFNAAHAICGNYDLAEYALRSAVLEVWLQNARGGMGFRERLRSALREEAFSIARADESAGAEFTWPGLPAREDDPILAQAVQERIETQRLLLLRHGCGLSLHSISQLTGAPVGQMRTALERFESRCRRSLPRQDRGHAEALITASLRRVLSRGAAGIPTAAQVYRAFEAEAEGMQISGHRFSRGVGYALTVLVALICAAAFWLFAVIVQPPAVGNPAAPAAVETPVPDGTPS